MKYEHTTTITNHEIKTIVSFHNTIYRLEFVTRKNGISGRVSTSVFTYEQRGFTTSFMMYGNLSRFIGSQTKYPRVTKRVLQAHHNNTVDQKMIDIFANNVLQCIADGYSPSETYTDWSKSKTK